MKPAAARLRENLVLLQSLRADIDSVEMERRLALKRWQAERLTRTYADLLRHPRYGKAADFFRSDLYGASDVRRRDRDVERVYPTMVRVLPANALETIATALELDALSESLDRDVAAILHTEIDAGRIDDTVYGEAYRRAGRRSERERQIELIVTAGGELDRLVRMPLVSSSLKLMRAPAKLAGLGELQRFLEKGHAAFREMRDAAEFLAIVRAREKAILQKLFAGNNDPFAVPPLRERDDPQRKS